MFHIFTPHLNSFGQTQECHTHNPLRLWFSTALGLLSWQPLITFVGDWQFHTVAPWQRDVGFVAFPNNKDVVQSENKRQYFRFLLKSDLPIKFNYTWWQTRFQRRPWHEQCRMTPDVSRDGWQYRLGRRCVPQLTCRCCLKDQKTQLLYKKIHGLLLCSPESNGIRSVIFPDAMSTTTVSFTLTKGSGYRIVRPSWVTKNGTPLGPVWTLLTLHSLY